MRMVMSYLRYLLVVLLFLSVGWFCVEVAGGTDDGAIAEALTAMTQVLAQANEQAAFGHRDPGEAEERRVRTRRSG
jgi:hypothetical protein